jgi:hypothetical protein
MKHLEPLWEEFHRSVLPDAPANVVEGMRITFYTGGLAVYSLLLNSALTEAAEPTDRMDLINELQAELFGFVTERKKTAAHERN